MSQFPHREKQRRLFLAFVGTEGDFCDVVMFGLRTTTKIKTEVVVFREFRVNSTIGFRFSRRKMKRTGKKRAGEKRGCGLLGQ